MFTGILCTCMLEHWAVHCVHSVRGLITNTSAMYARVTKMSIQLASTASFDTSSSFAFALRHVICIALVVGEAQRSIAVRYGHNR
jgi:hypothetical protein